MLTGALTAAHHPHRDHSTRHAFIGIRSDGDTRLLADALGELFGVVAATLTTGTFDAPVEVAVCGDFALLDLLNQRIRALPGVRATDVLMCPRHVPPAAAQA